MASKDFGGKITFKTSAGTILSGRGTFTVMPSRNSIEAVTNDDYSVARVATPKPSSIDITIQDDGQDFDALLKAARINFTAVEEFTNTTHLLSNAFFSGDVSINRKNGEVTGLMLVGEDYQKI